MIKRLYWFWVCDRLGPDIPLTHMLLYFKASSRWLCKRKFKEFGINSEFRAFAFAHWPSRISIGANIKIHPGSVLAADPEEGGTITIEDDVMIGAGVHIYVSNHRYGLTDRPISQQGYQKVQDITIRRGSWIGANCIILPGVTVGQNAVVGAGSIVANDVRPYTVVAGNPAKLIKNIESS